MRNLKIITESETYTIDLDTLCNSSKVLDAAYEWNKEFDSRPLNRLGIEITSNFIRFLNSDLLDINKKTYLNYIKLSDYFELNSNNDRILKLAQRYISLYHYKLNFSDVENLCKEYSHFEKYFYPSLINDFKKIDIVNPDLIDFYLYQTSLCLESKLEICALNRNPKFNELCINFIDQNQHLFSNLLLEDIERIKSYNHPYLNECLDKINLDQQLAFKKYDMIFDPHKLSYNIARKVDNYMLLGYRIDLINWENRVDYYYPLVEQNLIKISDNTKQEFYLNRIPEDTSLVDFKLPLNFKLISNFVSLETLNHNRIFFVYRSKFLAFVYEKQIQILYKFSSEIKAMFIENQFLYIMVDPLLGFKFDLIDLFSNRSLPSKFNSISFTSNPKLKKAYFKSDYYNEMINYTNNYLNYSYKLFNSTYTYTLSKDFRENSNLLIDVQTNDIYYIHYNFYPNNLGDSSSTERFLSRSDLYIQQLYTHIYRMSTGISRFLKQLYHFHYSVSSNFIRAGNILFENPDYFLLYNIEKETRIYIKKETMISED